MPGVLDLVLSSLGLMLGSLTPAVPAEGSAVLKCPRTAVELILDREQSTVRWKGTKFFGLGKHEGTVRFAGGALCVQAGEVVSGWFEVDLRTLQVTDIPEHEPVPRKRLRDHLLGPDFFHTAEHPVARFIVRNVAEERRGLYRIGGSLTIRGRTHPVTFYARVPRLTQASVRAEARLEVDRHQYGVSYRGSTIRDDLVDDTFWLDLAIVARSREATS